MALTDEQRDKKLDLIKNQVKIMMSSFDTVMVFATKLDPETKDTSQFNFGDGNWFARYGQAREWVAYEESANGRNKSDA
jgi:hypothetical protein